MDVDQPPIEHEKYYYLAPIWRRLVRIVVCGLIAVPMVAIAVRRLVFGQPATLHAEAVVVVGICCLVFLSLLRARIRVDDVGIASRGLFGWRMYRWAEILNQPPRTLCVGQQLWTDAPRRIRRLFAALVWIEQSDRLVVYQLMTPPGTCTHLPQIPDRFRMKVVGFKTLELDCGGLRIEDDGGVRSWFWNDVRLVKIRKESHTNSGIDGIRIELSDGTRFPMINGTIECECACQCRHDYLLQQFFRGMLRDDQLLIRAQRGEPRTIGEAADRCHSVQRDRRFGRRFAWGYAIGTAGLLFIGHAVENRICMRIAHLFIAYGVFFGPIFWGMMREQHNKQKMLQSWIEERAKSDVAQPLE